MKILFVCCYINNSHYMDMTRKYLDKFLVNISYDYICLNDAPNIINDEEDYLEICDILTGDSNCYYKIMNKAEENNFIHIKIPQNIHIKDRPNQGGPRHIENLNWFNQNIDTLYPKYKNYDYICHIDSDAMFVNYIDLNKELENCDLAGPFIYIENGYYIHTGLFFINVKTVLNFKDINWSNTKGTDTGSDIYNFIKNNPQYKIKKLGHYDGYRENNGICNGHTIVSLDIPDINDNFYKLIDVWFNGYVLHFRGGSCFGVGCNRHRTKDSLFFYKKKMEAFTKIISD